jgi:hypothetical protein
MKAFQAVAGPSGGLSWIRVASKGEMLSIGTFSESIENRASQ